VVDQQAAAESKRLKGMMPWKTKLVLRFLGSNPSPACGPKRVVLRAPPLPFGGRSPGPLWLEKAPAADHPLPKGEGGYDNCLQHRPPGERVANEYCS